MTERHRARREGVIRALLIAASLVVALALGEVGLRVFGFAYPSLYVSDDVTGWRLRAGAEGWNRTEGEAFVRINSQGLRDREHSVDKPEGVYRIAVLGDSYAEALQVGLEDTFWFLLPGKLAECGFAPGKRIEAINFGVSGYGTAQALLTLRERAWSYSPDLVLLAFFPGNDVRNNSKELEPERERPFFELRRGELVLDASFTGDPAYLAVKRVGEQRAVLQRLRLYQLLRKLRAGRTPLRHDAPIAVALADGMGDHAGLAEQGLDELVFREPGDAAWVDAWEVTESLLAALHEETSARGTRFLVAALSNAGAVHPDAELRRRYAELLRVPDLFYPETRIRRFGKRHGIDVVALGPQMQRHADTTQTYLHGFPNSRIGFGHWNRLGHELAASLIADHLCAK